MGHARIIFQMKEQSIFFLLTKLMQSWYDYFDHVTRCNTTWSLIELRLSAQNEGCCSREFSRDTFWNTAYRNKIVYIFCYILAFAWSLVAFSPPTLQWSCASWQGQTSDYFQAQLNPVFILHLLWCKHGDLRYTFGCCSIRCLLPS